MYLRMTGFHMLGMEVWFEDHSILSLGKKISPKLSHQWAGWLPDLWGSAAQFCQCRGTPVISRSGISQRLFTSLSQTHPEDQPRTSLMSCTLVSIFEDSNISFCTPLIIQSSFTNVWRKSQSLCTSLLLCLTHMALSLSLCLSLTQTHTRLSLPMTFPYIGECIILIHLAEDAFEINRGH